MFSCDHLSHPFQNDPGTSQYDRAPAGLLGDDTPIDGRQMSDLLNYFTTLATQINFYNTDLSVGSWKPFFQKSLPFLLSTISSYSTEKMKTGMASAVGLFQKHPDPDGLQLLFLQSYYTIIYPFHQWSLGLAGSGLDLEMKLQTLIRDRLVQPIQDYIRWANTAAHCFGVRPPTFNDLLLNTVWGLTVNDLTAYEPNFSCGVKSGRSQLLAVQAALSGIAAQFTDTLDLATPDAADIVNNDQELTALLANNGQQDTAPHLALLFSFLRQYQNVQADLNGLPKKHLDFFFQQVLSLSPGAAVADNAYIIFTIQKQLANYTIKGNTQLKAGKDSLGADIIFGVNQDTTFTQTQVTSQRTLFVNLQEQGHETYTEGVYMAPDATMADGVSKPFKGASNAAWPALGAKQSQYTPPGATTPIDYPLARLGFILASKVLLMKEGKRQVQIQLACTWKKDGTGGPAFSDIFTLAQTAVSSRWLLITPALLARAETMGVTRNTIKTLTENHLIDPCRTSPCDGEKKFYLEQAQVPVDTDPKTDRLQAGMDLTLLRKGPVYRALQLDTISGIADYEVDILIEVMVPQSLFAVSFSGEKAWLSPDSLDMELTTATGLPTDSFIWQITATIGSEELPVAFYNAAALGEDFGSTDPMVKIQLNDAIKLDPTATAGTASTSSCLLRKAEPCGQQMSAYEFFRNVILLPSVATQAGTTNTQIQVTVCGVTSLVVQNDDNVLDANKNFAPFGMKPVIVDFDVYPVVQPNVSGLNLVGPGFLIGSAEVFLKKWDQLYLNINWVGKPADFDAYYKVYTRHPFYQPADLNSPGHQVNLALLNGGDWYKEGSNSFTTAPSGSIADYNRPLFPSSESNATSFGSCPANDFQTTFSVLPTDFDQLPLLTYDPVFAPFTQYATSLKSGFLRLTLEYQDFLHKIYPWVLARQVVEQAHHKWRHFPAPNEPWTPMIEKGMSIDYMATALTADISLIQLYPFDGTYNTVDTSGEPFLFASFSDEGNLFVGLSGLVPGESLNLLFQLAEATGQTENAAGTLSWTFLTDNAWQPLRPGFEILQDDTNGLTTAGILRFALPDTISNNNTLLPSGQYWIRAALTQNTTGSSRIQAVLTQAALATFLPQKGNDPQRAATPLAGGSITKLVNPDNSIARLNQPYDSFGGSAPELSGTSYYLRVSERIRHKGRAIQKWDYERMTLQQFPQLLRVKCINHSTALSSTAYRQDFPMTPGSIIVAVLPDIDQLAMADNLRPMAPQSLLTAIERFFVGRSSPFIRVAARNPRYEPVDLCLTVILPKGSDPKVAQAQLQTELQALFAPWIGGDMTSFRFAQPLYMSDLVGLVESRDYIASLVKLRMARHGEPMGSPVFIQPLTPRSILVSGNIEITLEHLKDEQQANFWKKRAKK